MSEWSSLISNIFPFMHKRNFNPKDIYKFFLIDLPADINDQTFFKDPLSQVKISPNFSSGNSFLSFNRFEMKDFLMTGAILL